MLRARKFVQVSSLCAAIVSAAACSYLTPASAAAAAKPSGTQLIMLGTAGGPPIRKARAEPSTLLVVDGTAYLIDCGVGALRRMVEASIAPKTVGTIFITHHHPDHDLDLAVIMANDVLGAGSGNGPTHWNVYGPPGTIEMVDAAVRYIGVPFDTFAAEGMAGSDIKAHFTGHDIDHPGLVYQDDKIRVTAVENTHYSQMPAKYREKMKSYSYRIRTPHGVIVFTGDTGPSDAVAKFAEGADVLVSEVIDDNIVLKNVDRMATVEHLSRAEKAVRVNHMTLEHLIPKEVARLANEAHVRAVLLHHLVPGLNNNRDAKADLASVQAGYHGQTIVAHDLACYQVNPGGSEKPALSACK